MQKRMGPAPELGSGRRVLLPAGTSVLQLPAMCPGEGPGENQ